MNIITDSKSISQIQVIAEERYDSTLNKYHKICNTGKKRREWLHNSFLTMGYHNIKEKYLVGEDKKKASELSTLLDYCECVMYHMQDFKNCKNNNIIELDKYETKYLLALSVEFDIPINTYLKNSNKEYSSLKELEIYNS